MMRVGVIGPIAADYFAENILDSLPRLDVEPVALGPAQRRFTATSTRRWRLPYVRRRA